jgi:hypothetical protein
MKWQQTSEEHVVPNCRNLFFSKMTHTRTQAQMRIHSTKLSDGIKMRLQRHENFSVRCMIAVFVVRALVVRICYCILQAWKD